MVQVYLFSFRHNADDSTSRIALVTIKSKCRLPAIQNLFSNRDICLETFGSGLEDACRICVADQRLPAQFKSLPHNL